MGNESAKKRKKENAELMSKYNMILLGCNVSAHRRGHSHRVARVSACATCFSSCAGRAERC